jgi:hypothetical protein
MSKFLLNLLVQISKALDIKKFNFYSKRNFLRISAQPRPRRPATPHRPPAPRSPQAVLTYLPKGVFSLTLRTSTETPSLSHITAMWGLPVSSISFPTPADHCRFSSSPLATPHRPAPPSDATRAVWWGHQYFGYNHSFRWHIWPYHTITSTTIKSSGKLVLMLLRL